MPDAGLATQGLLESQPPMPVRRLHNYLYCARLFYLQWVENIFEENADTAIGTATHRQSDQPSRLDEERAIALREGLPEGAKLRSLRIESPTLGLVGLIDVVEGAEDGICVVDYKKGTARRLDDGTRTAKENDCVQVAAYALLLREQGMSVARAAIYYAEEKCRIPVALNEELFARTLIALKEARAVAVAGKLPPPLVEDVRCNHCSAYPVCLPRESAWWAQARERTANDDAQLRLAFPPGELPMEFTGEPPVDHPRRVAEHGARCCAVPLWRRRSRLHAQGDPASLRARRNPDGVKVPRGVNGANLAHALRVFGYERVRQDGSHIRLTTTINGTHHITVPSHRPLKTGTLMGGVLKPVAMHHKLTVEELVKRKGSGCKT